MNPELLHLNLERPMKLTSLNFGALLLALLALATFPAVLQAEIPEPDNIVYGTITRNGQNITAADTDVVLEARRTADGQVVASYRMGDSARSGNFYTLRVPLEAFAPAIDPLASLTSTPLVIAASDFNGVFAEAPFTQGTRGQFQRLNLVHSGGLDSDGDQLLDEWELAWFGNLLQSQGTDKDGDGITDGTEYLAGSKPNDPNSRFQLNIQRLANNGKEVSFVAGAAIGPGYQSKTREFTLEAATNLANPVWEAVPGYGNVVGAGQTVRYVVPEPSQQGRFYRVSIRLTEVGPPLPQ